jgi:hypothetical protein
VYQYIDQNLIYNIDDIFTKEDFYNFQGDKYIIGNSSLTLNNKFILYNEFKYKNKDNDEILNDHFNLRRLFPYITISFWFYIKNEKYDLILFNIVDNGRIDDKAHNSIYYENKQLKYKKHDRDDFNTHFNDITISNNISINKWYHLSIISHDDSEKSFMDQDVYNNYNPTYDYSDFSLSNIGSEYKLPQSNKTYFILDGILQETVNTYLFDQFSDTNNFICFGSFIKSDNKIHIIDQTADNVTLVKYGYIDDFRMYNTILSPKLIQKKLIGDILFINNKSINTIGNSGLIFTSFEEKLEIGNNQNNDYKLIVCGEIQSKNIKINNSTINTGSLLVFDDNCNITPLNQNDINLELNLGNNSIGQIRILNKILEMINIDSFQFKLNNNFIFSDESIGEPIFSYSNQQFKFNKTVHFEDNTTNGSGSDNINNGLIINGTLNTEQISVKYPNILNFKTEIGLIVDNNQYIDKELLVKEDITAFFQASDKRLKNNIKPLSKSINLIKKLKPVTFKWKKDIFNKNMSNKKDVGFIAQELEEILPLCVKNVNINNDSYKYLKHERIIPYLVNTIQELIERVEYLEKKI